MGKQAIDAKRSDVFKIEPERLTIVRDKTNPLYDPRAELEPSESMILNVMYYGVIEPIIVRKNGGTIEVIAGRQRTKAALEANKRLVERGELPLLVPAIIRNGNDADLFGVMISENEIRRDDCIIEKGKKARRLLNMGRDESELGIIFGVTQNTIKNWLTAEQLPEDIKNGIINGEISATDAIKNSNKRRDEQSPKIHTMKKKKNIQSQLSKYESLNSEYQQGYSAALKWVLGHDE